MPEAAECVEKIEQFVSVAELLPPCGLGPGQIEPGQRIRSG